jgi:hypothetical protein
VLAQSAQENRPTYPNPLASTSRSQVPPSPATPVPNSPAGANGVNGVGGGEDAASASAAEPEPRALDCGMAGRSACRVLWSRERSSRALSLSGVMLRRRRWRAMASQRCRGKGG